MVAQSNRLRELEEQNMNSHRHVSFLYHSKIKLNCIQLSKPITIFRTTSSLLILLYDCLIKFRVLYVLANSSSVLKQRAKPDLCTDQGTRVSISKGQSQVNLNSSIRAKTFSIEGLPCTHPSNSTHKMLKHVKDSDFMQGRYQKPSLILYIYNMAVQHP